MNIQIPSQERRISDALDACAPEVEHIRRDIWNLKMQPRFDFEMEFRLIDGWLLCRSPLRNGFMRKEAWSYLRANARLDGRSKIALDPYQRVPYLCEDIPVEDGENTEQSCREAISNMAKAQAKLPTFAGGESLQAERKSSKAIPKSSRNGLRKVCKEAGWSFSERTNGQLIINLEVPIGFHQAALEPLSKRTSRASVQLAKYGCLSEVLRDSIATYLLIANGFIRLARAHIEEAGTGAGVCFETYFSGYPSAVVLDHALSALSIACRCCARELQSLADERIARLYSSLQGWSIHPPESPDTGDLTQGLRMKGG